MQTEKNFGQYIPLLFKSGILQDAGIEVDYEENYRKLVRYLVKIRAAQLIEDEAFERLLKTATTTYLKTEVKQLVHSAIKIEPWDSFWNIYQDV